MTPRAGDRNESESESEGAGRVRDPPPVARYREVLASPAVYEFPITDLDHLGIPVWTTAQWHEGRMVTSTGYGLRDERARIGAWGELAERAVRHTLSDLPHREASYEELREAGADAISPSRLRLPVTTEYDHGEALTWVEATRHPSGEAVWVPIEAAATSPGQLPESRADEPLFTPITNGLGAGENVERALSHGLCELVQRDGNSVSYRATDRGIGIDVDSVADPEIRETLDRYDEAGLDVQVKLADVAFGVVSCYVVGRERDPETAPHPLMLTGCGEGAHPDREVALKKALLEFAASRVRKRFYHAIDPTEYDRLPETYREQVIENPPEKGEQRAYDAMAEWRRLDAGELTKRIDSPIFDRWETVRFSALPTVAPGSCETPADLLRCLTDRFENAGMDVLYVDCSPDPDVRVLKAIVPGMEVETMTYDRIGPRNLRRLLHRGSDLAGFLAGGMPESARRVPLTETDETKVGGPVWFDPAAARRMTEGLYALYREPARHALAMNENENGSGVESESGAEDEDGSESKNKDENESEDGTESEDDGGRNGGEGGDIAGKSE